MCTLRDEPGILSQTSGIVRAMPHDTHHSAGPPAGGGVMPASDLEARVRQLEHLVERLTKALALVAVIADEFSASAPSGTAGSASGDPQPTGNGHA